MAMDCTDNTMEWLTGDKVGAVTFTQKKFVSKIKKLAKEYDDVKIIAENEDGSIYAHVPVSWFKLSPPRKGRQFSEEEKAEAAIRLKEARAIRDNKRNNSTTG